MFNDDELLHPQRSIQRVGDFFEQRKSYRLAALVALRKREGLPQPVDESGSSLETRMDDYGNATYHNAAGEKVDRVLFAGTGKDGKPGSFAVGQRKGEAREDAFKHWPKGSEVAEVPIEDLPWHLQHAARRKALGEFEILEVAEDGRLLTEELNDLNRDARGMEIAQQVSYGTKSEQAPGFDLAGTSDEEVDARLQEYLKRGKE